MQEEKQRTNRQSRAMHLWFEHVASELNDAGLSMQKTLEKTIDIPWSGKSLKQSLFKRIMWEQYRKKSTTELTTKELTDVVETLTRFLADNFGLYIDFPSEITQLEKERLHENNS